MAKVAKKTLSRKYSQKTLKILFALSGNQCAQPTCLQSVIKIATVKSDALVVAQIAHIYALSVDGPRGKSGLTETELNGTSNLILLCPTHHVEVDGQYESYPAVMLIDWKDKHEKKFSGQLTNSISGLGFAELEVAAKALIANTLPPTEGFSTIPPAAKIQKNDLGNSSSMLLSMGAAKSSEVGAVLLQAAQLDPSFPDRLRAGFTKRYNDAKAGGLVGDDLFAEMYDWAAGGGDDSVRVASGLCILTHLFILCDVFEK